LSTFAHHCPLHEWQTVVNRSVCVQSRPVCVCVCERDARSRLVLGLDAPGSIKTSLSHPDIDRTSSSRTMHRPATTHRRIL